MESLFFDLSWIWTPGRYALPSAATQVRTPSIYRALNKSKREIRICELLPSSKLSAPLRCSLRIVPIDRAESFIAMSYVWGTAASTESISIDGIKHLIRPNLAAGLRRVRAMFSGQNQVIRVWADAICINQESIEERNHQVPLMRSIFSECESAFAWLGESDETSDLAMDCIVKMNDFCRGGLTGPASFLWMLVQETFFWEAEPWIALSRLLQREFWYRVWIYQEIVLPKDLVIACGTKIVPWESFLALNGMQILRGYSDKSRKLLRKHFAHLDSSVRNEIAGFCNALHPIFEHKVHFDEGNTPTLFELLAETIHLRSGDPRDKIYGLLALDQTSNISPDYSKTVQQVYTDFARTMLQDNLAYLRFGGLVARESNPAMEKFPSWVPHWESMSRNITASALQEGKCFESPRSGLSDITFDELSEFTILFIDGEISSKIISAKTSSKFLEIDNFVSMISKVNGTEYKTTIEYPKVPTQRILALCCTLVQTLFRKNAREDMEIAAGFCYTVCERLDTKSTWNTTIVKSELTVPFEEYFGWKAWADIYRYAENFQDDYLLREKETLEGRIFFETENEYFGLAPMGVEIGDLVCQIFGYHDPVILRSVESHYVLVGLCWALDYTDHYREQRPNRVKFEIW